MGLEVYFGRGEYGTSVLSFAQQGRKCMSKVYGSEVPPLCGPPMAASVLAVAQEFLNLISGLFSM